MLKALKNQLKRVKSNRFLRQVEKKHQLSIDQLTVEIVVSLNQSCPHLKIHKSRFWNAGGFNNAGMILHHDHQGRVRAITKLQPDELAQREWRFLQWQQKHLESNLAANPYITGSKSDTHLGWVTSECLQEADKIGADELLDLYRRIQVSESELSLLSAPYKPERLATEIEPNTPIKSLLTHLVSGKGSEDDMNFLRDYFDKRKDIWTHLIDYSVIEKALRLVFSSSKLEQGIVHGDFKKQNLMRDDSGVLKVIDLQYYTFGRRLWDLAFYYSKETPPLTHILAEISEVLKTADEKQTFVFFYFIASILKVKKRERQRVVDEKLKAAVAILVEA